eukprot:TRINITY_DN3417_c0_g1_i5.p2 TRINITY_DN3417_c0_g1~~TRINITY_DN3417_c0_g1_i5.p2  ORF type:complete len:263 (-),score=69.55 TRINITY_DN3417_c0_g1_i5:16-804(-)
MCIRDRVSTQSTWGDFNDFVRKVGQFSEPVARYYFKQLINGLEYLHQNGFAHRDIKLDNLLLNDKLDLKIADFGFATPLNGTEGQGQLRGVLGTKVYMAPEINLRKPYNGTQTDLFACGVVLFMMVVGRMPFLQASTQDAYYKLIYNQKYDEFWQKHANDLEKDVSIYSDEVKNLINQLLTFDPIYRINMADLMRNQWLNGEIPEQAEIQTLFDEVRQEILSNTTISVSYTHLRAHETGRNLVCRLLLEKKKTSDFQSFSVQ